jgi:Cu(I)/Ag(I) efflux system membrane fusion protein
VDPQTRTLKVRVRMPNADLKLRPGMFGDVLVEDPPREALVVAREAVVDTGESRYVFVALGGGRYEPRPVRTGVTQGERVQVLEGLAEGDTVVTTGNFLLDSESRLRATLDAAVPPAAGGTP